MNDFDWNHMRGFLAAAEAGSFSGGAKKLGLTQPTLSRQVAALEERLGVTLFERTGKTLAPTETALALLEHARRMGASAEMLSLAASGHAETIEGRVVISATDAVSTYLLPDCVAALRETAPGIVVDVVTSNAISDLRRREADIAIRHVRPEDPELIARRLREATAYFYASRDWIARHGHPRQIAVGEVYDFIGFDRDLRYTNYLRGLGFAPDNVRFAATSESTITALALTRAGLGIVAMMEDVACQFGDLSRVFDEVPPIQFPIWLVTHRELHTSRRIRIVFDLLAEHLSKPIRT